MTDIPEPVQPEAADSEHIVEIAAPGWLRVLNRFDQKTRPAYDFARKEAIGFIKGESSAYKSASSGVRSTFKTVVVPVIVGTGATVSIMFAVASGAFALRDVSGRDASVQSQPRQFGKETITNLAEMWRGGVQGLWELLPGVKREEEPAILLTPGGRPVPPLSIPRLPPEYSPEPRSPKSGATQPPSAFLEAPALDGKR